MVIKRSPQQMSCDLSGFACITRCLKCGLDAVKDQHQDDKIAETAQRAELAVHPVTKAGSGDEFLGLLFDCVHGRVSVENRRVLAAQGNIWSVVPPSPISCACLLRRACLSACAPLLMHSPVALPNGGVVFPASSEGPPAFCLLVFADGANLFAGDVHVELSGQKGQNDQ